MKFKSIEFKNTKLLDGLFIDFCDEDGIPADTVIIAGENGVGKTLVFEVLSNLNNLRNIEFLLYKENSEIIFSIFLDSSSVENYLLNFNLPINENSIRYNENFIRSTYGDLHNIILSFNYKDTRNVYMVSNSLNIANIPFNEYSLLNILYSKTDINFNISNSIQYVTSKMLDQKIPYGQPANLSTNENLAIDITQLLIDIKALDDADLSQWVDENEGIVPPNEIKNIRMKRFTNAFNYMFSDKQFYKIDNINNGKSILFKEKNNIMTIDKLSTGEKQIVFRGSFLLRDKNSTIGFPVLIDEPEISLHPTWQMKIVNYFKYILSDSIGNQTSQLFIATHSPFILHNNNRLNDKIIILKKEADGKIYCAPTNHFHSWTQEEKIKEAFNINLFNGDLNDNLNYIITEGKTDWKHMKRALKYLTTEYEFPNTVFLEYEKEEMSSSELVKLCDVYSKLRNTNKIIGILDNDITIKDHPQSGLPKNWGNNVYSFIIPVPLHREETPEISIEHYYTDEELKSIDSYGRRLFIGNEFNSVTGRGILNKDLNCINKNKCGEKSNKIIDSNVYDGNNTSVALSKNDFAEYILNDIPPFKEIQYDNFRLIFNIIKDILK